jgi:cell division protein FtsB
VSSPRRPLRPAGGARKTPSRDRGEGLRSINPQGLTALVMLLVGLLVLGPQFQLWFNQQQQISDLKEQVQAAKDSLKSLGVQRNRWNDPSFVRAQARNRLFYVMPGEVSYIVMDPGTVNANDVTGTVGELIASKSNYGEISTKISSTKNDWMGSVTQSIIVAGTTTPTVKK